MEKRINRGNCKTDAKSGIIQTAKNMLKKDIDIELIAEITGLSKDEIEKLNKKK